MAITIKSKGKEPSKGAISAQTPPANIPLPPKKDKKKTPVKQGKSSPADKEAKAALQSMDETLAKHHNKTDKELEEFIVPLPEVQDQHSYRLNEEQREARLVLMHRMLMRKVGPEEIRKQLGISASMYYKLKDQLHDRMRLDVNKVDVPYLIGDTMAFYDEVRSMALTISSSAAVKDPRIKITAMSVALKAEQDKNNFLVNCGVYSAPVVEHIVRGMVSTGQFSTVDGQSQRVIDAEEVNMELVLGLKEFAKKRAEGEQVDGIAINCNPAEG